MLNPVETTDPRPVSIERPNPAQRVVPIRKLVQFGLVGLLVAEVVATFSVGSMAYVGTSNKFHRTQSTLSATQQTLKETQSELKTTQAQRAAYLTKLNQTTAQLKSTQNSLATTQKNLSSTTSQLSAANQTISFQGGQISTLKQCLTGISTSYGYFLNEDYTGALAALEAAGPSCQAARRYL